MANRLSKIVTRTGDTGETGLGDGSRISKHAPRIHALGEVDELNSQIGLVLCEAMPETIRHALKSIQTDLFDIGADLCIPGYISLTEEQLIRLDGWISQWNATLPPLKEFILPGGCRGAALMHVARTICRRAERHVVALSDANHSPFVLPYLNRLSDLLFILARTLNQIEGVAEPLWRED